MTYPLDLADSATPKSSTPLGYSGLVRFLTGPGAIWKVALLAFVMTLPAIAMGMVADDYALAEQVEADPFSAYAFQSLDPAVREQQILAARDAGEAAWWIDPGFHQAFFRPLSSLSLALDFRVWPQAVWFMHVENGLLMALIVLLVAALFRELELAPAALGLATFFYATNSSMAMTTGFIAGRNTLLTTVFGVLALLLHVRAARPGAARPRLQRAGALLAFALGLLSGEGALAVSGYLVSHACVLPGAADRRPLLRRLLALWPYLLLAVVWQVGYRAGGYGAAGSAFYRDPDDDPLGVLIGVLTGIPIYMASQLTLPYAVLTGTSPSALWPITALSLLLLYLMRGLLLPPLREDARARFLTLGAALAAAPLGTTLPQDRLVNFIAVGISGLLAIIIEQRLRPDNPPLLRAGARGLFYLHALLAPVLYLPWLFGPMGNVLGGGSLALEHALPRDGQHGVLLVNGPSHLPVYFQRLMRERAGVTTVPFIDMLYAGGSALRVLRPAQRTLEVDAARGYLSTIIERHANDLVKHPFRVGQTLDIARMHITLLEVTSDGAPKRVRFDLRYDPDAGEVIPMAWFGHQVRPWRLPAVGQSAELPAVSPI
jgi:hypothetical protein